RGVLGVVLLAEFTYAFDAQVVFRINNGEAIFEGLAMVDQASVDDGRPDAWRKTDADLIYVFERLYPRAIAFAFILSDEVVYAQLIYVIVSAVELGPCPVQCDWEVGKIGPLPIILGEPCAQTRYLDQR